jgi:NADH:ubiquinone oxidoreductase subunit 2 (subunit N)
MIILYGLLSLRNKQVSLTDVHFFCLFWPVLVVFNYLWESAPGVMSETETMLNLAHGFTVGYGFDLLLCALTFAIMLRFGKSFESLLLIMMAYIGQAFMLHSCDLVSFYVCLEGQNFCFLVLCGLQPDKQSSGFSVESSLKYLLLSAFSSGMLLFWFSSLYLRTGMSVLFFKSQLDVETANMYFMSGNTVSSPSLVESGLQLETFQILLALMFKLGTAPIHLWVVDIYQSIKKPLLMYISTAPKLSVFCFWVSTWHQVWTDFSVALFVGFCMLLGSIGAYGQPALRALFAYSTINEIGLMLLAIEAAGFHSVLQHLVIYIVTQLLLWNLNDKRLFSVVAVSLAGLPPLAGFFGKAWIFWQAVNVHLLFLLAVALLCTCLGLVYYLRVLRLFWNRATTTMVNHTKTMPGEDLPGFTSLCAVFLGFAPIFLVKPFVL